MSVYLDASVILPTMVEEAASEAVDRFLAASTDLVISDFAAAEVASAISRLVRMGLLSADAGQERLAAFDAWRATAAANLDIHAADARLANIVVRRFDLALRAPDALHIAACRRGAHELATLDRRLGVAAEALGLRVITPAEGNG